MVQIVESPAEFERLRDEWDDLLAASSADGVFLTHEWLHSWWKHLGGGRGPRVVTVRDGGRLIAIAPVRLAPPSLRILLPFRRLEFLGTGSAGSDYLDLIVRRG